MAIDIPRSQRKVTKSGRTHVHSPNPNMKLLGQLYSFLSRRTDSKFNQVVAKRLMMSKRNKAPIGLRRLASHMAHHEGKIACIVGTVTDDTRVEEFPTMTVCALRFTEGARHRITKAGGECLTFDQLVMRAPKGNNCVLLRGHTKSRVAEKYFGRAPGLPGSHTRPRGCCKTSH
eukprot:Gregarina_sp_Pseudo_9__700@NODE_1445_length_1596_cov_194_823378_g1342_i0_p2_GENE_NODE_1445_length_1596_cov_194_823378_g1342_i0NODE_1445_length_1596_cov_194_823378_g1342_i0_p2_ORF_typecomplete_len174_score26_51Ribosomal_L18/PF17135_4/2_2e60Ribosomal_L27A/PF00828_19/0_0004Nudc_N/PF14050_6/0_18Nudc_N/PF14050_6/2_5e03_NODE_1445_length_1596_cov_194_823378_g1342_i0137658